MNDQQFTHPPGHGPENPRHDTAPSHHVSRADRLRALLSAEEHFAQSVAMLAADTTSPTEAAALALIVEKAHRRTDYARVLVAQGVERTLAHELPISTLEQLAETVANPQAFIRAEISLPMDPATVPSGRLPHKNSTDLLQHLLGCSFFQVRDRLQAVPALFPHTDLNGFAHPARYPQLSAQAKDGKIDPKQAIDAARKLDKAVLVLRGDPDAGKKAAALEAEVLESLRTQGPAATGKLISSWKASVGNSEPSEPSAEEIDAKTGIFLTRRTEHFSYFSLCMLNVEAEVLLSHFANADNPRTAAGNRENLASDATSVAQTNGQVSLVGVPANDEAPRLPAWAADPATPVEQLPLATYTDVGLRASKVNASGTKYLATASAEFPSNAPASEQASDGLTPARRRLQAILNVLRSVDGTIREGLSALSRATLVVHCQLETLLGLAERSGVSAHGLEVSPGELRRMLCNAGVLPIVFSGQSQILDVGREQRFVPDYMRQAILARDGGCLVPECTVPPEHCEMCHIDAWEDGGTTSVSNSGPGCQIA